MIFFPYLQNLDYRIPLFLRIFYMYCIHRSSHLPRMSQNTQHEFLNSLLTQAALPYAEETKWDIRQHLLRLAETHPSLWPKTAVFTHNDGRAVNLLQADGTVPMTFQGASYNIPVVIWLTEAYPLQAPLVYLNPTREMTIKRHHPFASPDGVVSVPYIGSWIFPSSNLVELARDLSLCFARDPPLYSQIKPPNPNCPNPSGIIDERIELLNKNLVENLYGDIMEGEIEGLLIAQSELRNRDRELRKGLREMVDEKEALEQQLQIALMNIDILEGWIRENETKQGIVSVDEAFEVCDGISEEMSDCAASDMAVEDTLYALDKAVQEGAIPFDQYMKCVRLLCRDQFVHRDKTNVVRMQASMPSMAS